MKNMIAKFTVVIGLLTQLNVEAVSASSFFLSSENGFARNDVAALREIDSFVFLFHVQMEKEEVASIIDFFNQELGKIGRVVKKEIFTDRGMDIECFSNSRLRLSLEQLVDSEGRVLPALKTQLAVNSVVEVSRNHTLVSANTNAWTLYLNGGSQTTLSALKKNVPQLLQLFLADFVKANSADKKPTFFVVYDASWWMTTPQSTSVEQESCSNN